MTAVDPQEQLVDEEQPEPSRIAGGCVLAVVVGAAGATAYAVPEVGYFVAGLLATSTVRKTRGWLESRRPIADDDQDEDEEQPVDIVGQLRALAVGGEHVRLTQLQEATGLPDTKAVRVLLDEAGIPIRTGVRAGGKNGPGVHQDDIPPVLPSSGAPLLDRCLCRSEANTNANNGGGEGPEKGFRVEPIGQAGTVVHDPAETQRRQAVPAK